MMFAMTTRNQTQFRAELVPNRSLSPAGFTILMSLVAGLSFIAGIAFLLVGAWPVLGFFGLDVLLIYGAFKLSFRDSERREIVEVNESEVLVTRLAPGRPAEHKAFQRLWLRIELDEDKERELIGKLRLIERGKAFEIASFLGPEDRQEFYWALKDAVGT